MLMNVFKRNVAKLLLHLLVFLKGEVTKKGSYVSIDQYLPTKLCHKIDAFILLVKVNT